MRHRSIDKVTGIIYAVLLDVIENVLAFQPEYIDVTDLVIVAVQQRTEQRRCAHAAAVVQLIPQLRPCAGVIRSKAVAPRFQKLRGIGHRGDLFTGLRKGDPRIRKRLYLFVSVLPLLKGLPLFLLLFAQNGVRVCRVGRRTEAARCPQRIRQLLRVRVHIALTGEDEPAVAAYLKRVKCIIQPVLHYGGIGLIIAAGIQIDAPAFLIVPRQQIQQCLHPAAWLAAAAQQRGLRVLTVDILAVLLPCLQQPQRVRHGAHSHRHLRGVPAVQQRRDLLPGQLRFAEYCRIAHAVHAVTFHTVGGHCFGAALAAPRQRRQRQQAQ